VPAPDLAVVDRSLLASWAALARRAPGAALRPAGEADAAIFPRGPARAVFNNALLRAGAADLDGTLAAVRGAYAAAGVEEFALWVHESRADALAVAAAAGWRESESTRAMAADLAAAVAGGGDATAPVERLSEPAELFLLNGVTADLLDGWPPGARGFVARGDDGRPLSGAMAFHRDGDCAAAFVATDPAARRRGLARAVLAALLADAVAAGCETATLHSTPEAEPLYARAGFRDLGRMVELAPPER